MDYKEMLFQMNMKRKMKDCFRAANLYFTSKLGDKTIYIYPKVHSVIKKDEENCTEITFTLMNGLDPTEVKKKMFAFQQVFGRSIELKGEIKKFVLYIYHNPLKSN
ncbi:hypothetical protein NDK43_03990 [Neobacillus pocheonensis]|uniref:Uncharacterized protein n=1 Tax=Neobacillus pocheonensis TaxID=363869 RepID=A0ABT0W5W5_9BACI|nr:hypothetical protein [Neobacillus pocheonensis]